MQHIVELKIFPSSGRQELKAERSGAVKCYLKSPPEKGKANEELVKFLAKKAGLATEHVMILSGATTRIKRVRFETSLSRDELYKKLGIEFPQLSIEG